MNEKKFRGFLLLVEVGLVVAAFAFHPLFPDSGWLWVGSYANVFAIIAVFIGGIPVLIETIRALLKKDLTADLLFIIALSATEFLGGENHIVGAILILMMGGGEFLEALTIDRAGSHLEHLLELQPREALLKKQNSNTNEEDNYVEVPIEEIEIENVVLVRSGERIPLDGNIIHGNAEIDCSILTGESKPTLFSKGDTVMAGMLVLDGVIDVEITRVQDQSTISRISDLIHTAREEKAPLQMVTDHWAQYFAPIILITAVVTWLLTQNLFYTISVLLVSCPCSLVLSVPTAFLASFGNAAKHGILIKSGRSIEDIGRVNMVVLDKTGTLTFGKIAIDEINITLGHDERSILTGIKSLETRSVHPLAKSLVSYIHGKGPGLETVQVDDFRYESGLGVTGTIPNKGKVFLGNERYLKHVGLTENSNMTDKITRDGYALYYFTQNDILARISFKDVYRSEIRETMNHLVQNYDVNLVLMTGDNPQPAQEMADHINANLVLARAQPKDKVKFIKEAKNNGAIILMVGDGVNDAPALALSDVAIAMGKDGTALAAEQSDVVLMDDEISKLPRLFALGKRCVNKARVNIIIAIILNVFGILLSAFGLIIPIGASLYHVVQSLIVVGNSTLLLKSKNELPSSKHEKISAEGV